MMASGDYVYTNDLDEGSLMGTAIRRREQSCSVVVEVTHDSTSESQSQYDYLDGSLAGGYDDGGDVELAALALEDFVGVDGSNLVSVQSESNSAFDIGTEEANTETPNVVSRSVSGADFDTLPIAPTAKKPIEEPPAVSALHPAAANTAVSAHHLNLRINTVTDVKRPSTPDKCFESFGGSLSPTAERNNTANFNASVITCSPHHRGTRDTGYHHGANATVAAARKVVTMSELTSKLSTLHPEAATDGVSRRPSVPPAPPSLNHFSSMSPRCNDREGLSFGIETFLHGNRLGFGRQPSFKRLTPAVPCESKKIYVALACEDGDTSITTATDTAGVADRNAEAFSAWLEALQPKMAGPLTSAGSDFGTTHTGAAVGENFKREVDVLMRNLLGDYDVSVSATAAATVSNSSTLAVSPSAAGGSAAPKRRRGSGPSSPDARATGSGDSQAAVLDTFVANAYTFNPPLRSPAAVARHTKQRLSQWNAVGSCTPLGSPQKVKEAVQTTVTAGTLLGSGAEEKVRADAGRSPSATTSAPPQPPAQGNATNLRGSAWSTFLGPHKTSTSAAVASNGEMVPDLTATVTPEALSSMTSANATGRLADERSAQHPSVAPTSQPMVAMNRAPKLASRGSTCGSVAGVAKPPPVRAATASAKPEGCVDDVARVRGSASCSMAAPYPYMDEDLLAGGYMTGPPQMIRSPLKNRPGVLPTAHVALEPSSTEKINGRRSGSNTSHLAPAGLGCHCSLVDGHMGGSRQRPSLVQQKLHPSWNNLSRGDGGTKSTTTSNPTRTAASETPQQTSATEGFGVSSEPPTPVRNKPCGRAATSLPAESATAASRKMPLYHRIHGDSTLHSVDKAFRSLEAAASEGEFTDKGGMRARQLPLPAFLGNDSSAQQGMIAINLTAGADATRSHLDCVRKGGETEMPTGCIRRFSRRSVVEPVTVEPIALRKDALIPLRPTFGSLRASASRTDWEAATSGDRSMAATLPRRRLTEFRNGEYMLPIASIKSRVSAVTAEDLRSESVKQRDRDRQTQQANEERRQRIQAFMAKRKAEKQLEELRRRQMPEQKGRPGAQEQPVSEATPPRHTPETVGSGLNAIKASKRMRKPSPQRGPPVGQPVAAAIFIPEAAMTATVCSPHIKATAAAVADPLPPARRGHSSSTANKTNVRAVVVLMGSADAAKGGAPVAVKDDCSGQQCSSGSTAPSRAGPGLLSESTVTVELNEGRNTLKVQHPQERTRFFSVDEFLRIDDAAAQNQVQHPVKGTGSAVVSGAPLNGALPRRCLSSLTLKEMNRKFLAGVNVALLLASTENAHCTSLMAIREVVEGVLTHVPPQGELFASIAFVAGGRTQDLLSDTVRAVHLAFSTSPLFGPTLDDVTYVAVAGVRQLLNMVTDAYKRCDSAVRQQHLHAGLLVMSLLLKQSRGSDVVLSSYLITDAGCCGNTYVAVLRKAQNTPFSLFHSALGGPTLTTALVSVNAGDTATVVPLLNVQQRLASVVNKPCHVGSVRRFLELAQQELQNRPEDEKSGRKCNCSSTITKGTLQGRRNSVSISSNNSASEGNSCPPLSSGPPGHKQQPGTRAQLHKRLVEQVAMAQSILNDPVSYRPRAPREASKGRRASVLTATPHSSKYAGPLLSVAAAPLERPRSVDGSEMPNVDKAAPRKRLSTRSKAADSAALDTADTLLPPSQGAGAALAVKRSPLLAALAESSQGTQLLAARRPSDAPNAESEAGSMTKTSLSLAATRANHQISRFRPLQQQKSSLLAGHRSASTSVSAAYVRRGNDCGTAPSTTWFMNFEELGDSTCAPEGSRPGVGTLLNKGDREDSQDALLHATTTMPAEPLPKCRSAGKGELSRRGKFAPADGAGGPARQPLCAPPSMASRAVGPSRRGLSAVPTRIGSNGPQWPSNVDMDPDDIPIVPTADSIDSSFVHEVSEPARQSAITHYGENAPIPRSTKVHTLVIVDPRCRETSNVTYDNTMVIATTEDDFEEYDVGEVCEAAPTEKKPIQAALLTELCETVLLGGNAAILGADSRSTGISAQVLKSVVHKIFADMNREGAHRSGRLSASIVKVKGESVVDLLKDAGEVQKLVIAISPLFGSCVHGVTYANIESSAAFNATIDAALSRAASEDNGRDHGFLFCSFILKLQLEKESDVLVCSLVATLAGEHVGLYTSVLDRSPLVPRALFHYALGGPSYTIALLGIGSEESRANQMLQVQRRLGEVRNRATHPGSVAKFIAGIRNDLTPNLMAKYESLRDQGERGATKEMISRLAEMVKDAEALLHDFDHHHPKAYLHGDQDRGTVSTDAATVKATDPGSPAIAASCRNIISNLTNSTAAVTTVVDTSPPATRRPAAQRALPCVTAVGAEVEGDHIRSLVCYEQVLMGGGSVAVQGNSILCTSQGGMRYDSDEVIVCDEAHRSLSSKLIDELVAKFLTGYHTGLLAADSSYSAFTPLMLRRIANSIFEAVLGREAGRGEGLSFSSSFKPPTVTGELHLSIALIKDDLTADLLPADVDTTYNRFEMEHRPLYGPRLAGVTSHLVSTPQDFDHFLAVAIDNADPALQSADPGIMVVSLTLIQSVTKPAKDVLVSSLLCTAVFDAVHHYERVLEGDLSEPLELFHNILRGPCFSVALFGISDEEENPGKLLRALHGITQARNRPLEVNSVSRYIREMQRGIAKLNERMFTSCNKEEREYILSRVKVAERLLADAQMLQRCPLSMLPRAFVPLGAAADLRA
ncbi:hypothetical protein GH5_02512 [Leishmania sp. Ghana 2012 LV757]|uniref:hypothetical protein n=1 Tax=Leishmania sp. Ghana 2012 LV757 TaxID=2803181 RepID=UPI001B49B16D|nr:hypothetical protein GH5_02512 [Leishmania sp. Ghana 2012 LV757]